MFSAWFIFLFIFPWGTFSFISKIHSQTTITTKKYTRNIHSAAFGQATITIPASNLSIPLAGNSLGNLTTQNATNTTAAQQNQSTNQNQTTTNANAQNQQTHQSVTLLKIKTNDFFLVLKC